MSASAESVSKRPSVRRNSSRSRHNRGSSRRNKENGANKPRSPAGVQQDSESGNNSNNTGGQTFHVKVTYKPRI